MHQVCCRLMKNTLLMSHIRACFVLAFTWRAHAFTTAPQNAIDAGSMEANVLREWLSVGNRCSSTAATIEVSPLAQKDGDDCSSCIKVVTTREVSAGEVIFKLTKNAIWSEAYGDRDIGPKLKDYAVKAGPGFGTVSLAGGLAAEKVRRFRSREGLGVAPESAGFTVPSKNGAFARYLWSYHNTCTTSFDESLVHIVTQGVNLLVPLLDVAARRYWSAEKADEPEASVLEEEWTRKALLQDGAPRSWSRSDLENVAMDSMKLVLDRTRYPPRYLLDGTGSLVPEPFVDTNSDPPETWPSGETLAFVPLVDGLFQTAKSKDESNAVLGSPPRNRHGGAEDCLWCVATCKINIGEQVYAVNPWV
jgi:hypothetical protein